MLEVILAFRDQLRDFFKALIHLRFEIRLRTPLIRLGSIFRTRDTSRIVPSEQVCSPTKYTYEFPDLEGITPD